MGCKYHHKGYLFLVCFGVIGTVFAFIKRTKETLGTRIKNPMFRVFLVVHIIHTIMI